MTDKLSSASIQAANAAPQSFRAKATAFVKEHIVAIAATAFAAVVVAAIFL